MGHAGGMLFPPQSFPPIKPQLRESWEQLCFWLLPAFLWEPWVQHWGAEVLHPAFTQISSRDQRCS